MATYSSIRIYLSSNKSILAKGFYDVIGAYGSISIVNGTLSIDVNNSIYPVVRIGQKFYYLTYNADDGYLPTEISDDTNLVLGTQTTSVPIYQGVREDAYLIDSAGYPLNTNIVVLDIASQKTAYRTFSDEVYSSYALRSYGDISDKYNLLDEQDADFSLVPTTPDIDKDGSSPRITGIDPASGIVESLYKFTITFSQAVTIDKTVAQKISVYDANTKTQVAIDRNSFSETNSVTTFTFCLIASISAASTYYLYLPTGLIEYSSTESSSLNLIPYKIQASSSKEEQYAYILTPSIGLELSAISVKYINLRSVVVASNTDLVTVTVGSEVETFKFNEVISSVSNTLTFDFGKSWTNSTSENIECTISIPAETLWFYLANGNQTVNEATTYTFTLLPQGSTLPSDHENVSYSYSPANDSPIYGFSYWNLFIRLEKYTGDVSYDNDKLSEITISDSSGIVGTPAGISAKSPITSGNLTIYEFNFAFNETYRISGSYTISVPKEFFTISLLIDGKTETVYSSAKEVTYTIKQGNPDTEGGDTTTGTLNSFYYKLISVYSNQKGVSDSLAFRINDTIFVNKDLFSRITTTPYLSLTKYDSTHDNAIASKERLDNPKKMVVSIRASYYNESNALVDTVYSASYGSETDVLTQILKGRTYPRYVKLLYEFSYGLQELKYETELQFVPNILYHLIQENPELSRTTRIDLYSSSQTEYQYGCLKLTNSYDSISTYTDSNGNIKYQAEIPSVTKVRTGNLTGINNPKFGTNQPSGYGLYGDSVFLTGNFYLNNGKSLLDISDDILLANGDISALEENLTNLETSIRATVASLADSLSNFEIQLDDSIENFIVSNKNALLKIGLDYSIWALGNAGISLINPNAKYIMNEETGEWSIDPNTVGDLDEYISLQGSKVMIKTYATKTINSIKYNEVIFTTVNPILWEYEEGGSVFVPKYKGNAITFYKGYIQTLSNQTETVDDSTNNGNILRNVAFSLATVESGKFTPIDITGEDSSTYESYSFQTSYTCTPTMGSSYQPYVMYVGSDGTQTLTSARTLGVDGSVYYLPRIILSGLFSGNKFNADFIEAKNIVAIDTTNDSYVKNEDFDPSKEINSDSSSPNYNYPVYKKGTTSAATDSAYAVISGTTGKISAKDANINGTITIGKENSGSPYLQLANNIAGGPGMGIYDSSGKLATVFSGDIKNDPKSAFSEDSDETIINGSSAFSTNSATASYWQQTNSITKSLALDSSKPALLAGITYVLNKVSKQDVTYTLCSFTLASGAIKSLAYTVASTLHLSKPQNDIDNTVTGDVSLGIYQDGVLIKTLASNSGTYANTASVNSSGVHNNSTQNYVTFNKEGTYLCSNSKSSSSTYSLRLALSVEYWGYANESDYKSSNRILADDFQLVTDSDLTINNSSGSSIVLDPSSSSTTSYDYSDCLDNLDNPYAASFYISGTISNVKLTAKNYLAQFFGNGLAIGYDSQNYFTNYFKSSDADSELVFDFQSNGVGMKFEGGNVYNYLYGRAIQSYIPILQGTIFYNNSNGDYFTFSGVSLFSTKYVKTSTSNTTTNLQATNLPCFKSDGTYASISNTNTTYAREHDIYLTCFTADDIKLGDEKKNKYFGGIVLNFGDKWKSLFGKNNFATEDSLLITSMGRGRAATTEDSVTEAGTLYVTVRGVSNYSGTSTNPGKIGSSFTPNNWIHFYTSDDYTLNKGTFYISISYCPNT